jgi:hypothetical protein
VADTIEKALRERGALTRTEISGLFHRNLEAGRLEAALTFLEADGRAWQQTRATAGRPVETWTPRP